MSIHEIKADVQAMLKEKYPKRVNLTPVKFEDVERGGFMRKKDAEAISTVCNEKGIFVSFRAAGKSTIDRINAGNPCKGHDILDKSIKFINEEKGWSYDITDQIGNEFQGYIGVKKDSQSEPAKNELAGIYVLPLDGGSYEKIGLDKCNVDVLKRAYTGDYDLHDLCKFGNDKYSRLIATTPLEQSTIDMLNSAMLINDPTRKNKVNKTKTERL